MNNTELIELIKSGEGLTLEFKEDISSTLGKEICAFANAKGGRIILGIKDNGETKGIKTSNQLKSQIQSYARNIDPAFSVNIENVGDLIVIHVPEGDKKPYSANGQFFLRVGANSQQLNRDEVREFFQKENQILFDSKPNTDFDIKKDFNENKFAHFLKLAKLSDKLNKKKLLKNLFLLDKNDSVKNAGVLFFCHRITKFFYGAIITCVLYKGTSKTEILDKKEFNADILSNYDNAFLYLISKLNTNYIIKRERTEKLELPEEALREAIINAVAHRDYFSTGHIQIDIFLDRVEISNPGGLVKGLTKKDFGKVSLPRNQLIMDLMLRVNKVEKIGSGIGRIKDSMKAYGLDVKFESTGFFTVLFKRPSTRIDLPQDESRSRLGKGWEEVGSKLAGKVGSKLAESQIKILSLIADNPAITKRELSEILKISTTAIDKNISKLKALKLIKRVGPDKGGHWEIKE
jgi:ATP-dependent DNA helicase RecG